ncbi:MULTISPECIES: DUF1707 and DUF4190 domain-containing protein [unclassified Streptomyces]|uniref:DUF1707 and DUF4190 domain-containing protein n=2 Tax=unclassified Streptomyces TaxID=2593676 RepID=UPI0033A235BF
MAALRHYGYMLAGDADRERAVNVLNEAFTEGRLKQEEYEDRLGRAYAARTYGDLDRLTADIPRPSSPYPVPPTFGAPQPFRYAPPVAPVPKTNGAAIGALVCSLVGSPIFGMASIGAVVLGHTAKRQIRERGEQGDGMATAGLVIGYLGLAFWALIWVVAIFE